MLPIPLPLVNSPKYLGIVIDSVLKMTIYTDAAFAKAISSLAFISRTFQRLFHDIVLQA